MCFHSKQSKDAQTIEHRFKATFKDSNVYGPSDYNGFQFPKTPVITNQDKSVIEMAQWGLIPAWAKADWDTKYTLNARVETIEDKPAFKDSLNNRCIILVDGFYEWQHQGKNKIQYEIGFNNELFAFAGIYALHQNIKTYSIITTAAQGIMQTIHNTKLRMPIAFNTDDAMHNWLDNNILEPCYDFTAKPLSPIQGTLF